MLADGGFGVLQCRFECLPCGIWGVIGQQCQGVHAHVRVAVFPGQSGEPLHGHSCAGVPQNFQGRGTHLPLGVIESRA